MDAQETDIATFPLLRTKLYRPRIDEDIVPRPRLLESLKERRGRPLTLVSAPAGYGKTTLVNSWLDECDCPSAWLSLDEYDSDLAIFLNYVLAAVQSAFPESELKTQAMLNVPSTPPVPVLARSLVSDLERLEPPFILVLDDFHHIQEMAVYELLRQLLRHPPRSMHLVIVTRDDPALNLDSLRAKRQMTEIRLRDLSFTLAETSAFMNDVMGFSIDYTGASRLRDSTEGWAAALRLAALSLRHHENVDELVSHLQADSRYLQNYLVEEVFSHQPPAIQDWLLKTSILDRFCAPLCEAVCLGFAQAPSSSLGTAVCLDKAQSDGLYADSTGAGLSGPGFIQWLESANLFLVPLDSRGEWFRFHHLFQHLIQSRLEEQGSPDEIAALHVRATEWLDRNDIIDEALKHALAAGDNTLALQLVARHRQDLLNRERWRRLDGWLNMFSSTTLEDHPAITVLTLWRRVFRRLPSSDALVSLDRAESQLAQTPMEPAAANQLQGEIDFLRSYHYSQTTDPQQSQFYAQRALDALPDSNHGMIANLHTILAVGHILAGAADRARQHIDRELAQAPTQLSMYRARLLFATCLSYWYEADLSGLARPAARLLKYAQDSGQPESVAIGFYFMGCLHYSRNQLTAVEEHLVDMVRNHVGSENYVYQNAFILALTYLALDRTGEAQNVIDSVGEFATEMGNPGAPSILQAFQAELDLRQGRLVDAELWASLYDPYPLAESQKFYVPQLTLVKVLLAQDTTSSRSAAEDLLARLTVFLQSINVTCTLIDVLALEALLHDARGDEPAATQKLAASLALGEPGGFIRKFVDLGAPMYHLLSRLKRQEGASDYVNQILAAFPPATREPTLIDPLTERELQVLRLLATERSTQEIAATMVVSMATFRTHTKRIYSKLDAHSRHEAVQRAQELGLL
jgi:LuxR family maltose regulon positive regulatory protein